MDQSSWSLHVLMKEKSAVVENLTQGGKDGFKFHLHPWPAVWSWVSGLTSLSLGFLICKMRILIVPSS